MKIEKRVFVFAIAIGCGILAILLTKVYIKQSISKKEAEFKGYLGDTAIVLVAQRDIPKGATIKDNMVELKKVPSNFAQPNALASQESSLNKIASVDIAKGEQILSNKLSTKSMDNVSPGGSLAMRTPVGKRAITISLDALSAAGGMVTRGDYVDIIGDFPISQQFQGKLVTQQVTVTLFQNVLVLDVGPAGGMSTITLALTPQEAAFLSYGQQQGKIRLLLRPPLETETQVLPPVSVDSFWTEIMRRAGISVPSTSPEKQLGPPSSVEVYRGSKKEELPLQEEAK